VKTVTLTRTRAFGGRSCLCTPRAQREIEEAREELHQERAELEEDRERLRREGEKLGREHGDDR
jgi:hypothetical protein